ncbi:MAG: UDP-N-acetylmuramoyl-L-alanine--D-glutamate ligase [Candidatus Puniceispirillaceae bacterium]|jgi:UDP-N-acetylmuramoylalanine--D-glutamate ligase
MQHSCSLQIIGILGMGRSGRAVLQRAEQLGITAHCFDDSQPEYQTVSPADWPWQAMDALVISPGIPHNHPAPHLLAQMALDNQVEIISEIEFSIRTGRAGRWVVITGTNGKSTTASLLAHILEQAGVPAQLGGNIGTAITSLPATDDNDILVVEASSYQLETTPSLAPEIGMLLNLTPDHLDRHGGMEGYIAAKANLLRQTPQTASIICGTDAGCTRAREIAGSSATAYLLKQADIEAEFNRGIQLSNPGLQGRHNSENCAAARIAAQILGCDDEVIDAAIASFSALAHRLQPVARTRNIQFINDSKATNGVAATSALSSFQHIYWLAGGQAKEDGITPCLDCLGDVEKAYFYGQSADMFSRTADGHIPVSVFGSLNEAVDAAFSDAQLAPDTDDMQTILLSPAAASFDQFDNFEARGDAFSAIACALADNAERQVSC